MRVTFSVSTETGGLEKIIVNCDSKPPVIVREFGLEVEGLAKGFSPIDTGWLRSSLQSFMIAKAIARIQSDANYDIYQEFGTYKMAAHPFLTPAIEQVAGRFLSPATWSPLIYE
jgi:HK97 gp10 family phage protein